MIKSWSTPSRKMPLDTFICGNCQETFTDLSDFVNHKQRQCSPAATASSATGHGTVSKETEVIQLHMNESGEITGLTTPGLDDEETKGAENSTLAFLNNVDIGAELSNTSSDVKEVINPRTTHLIILNSALGEGDNNDGSITLLNNVNLEGLSDGQFATQDTGPSATDVDQVPTGETNQTGQANGNQAEEPPKKRRGRGKASDSKNKALEAVPPTTPKPSVPEKGADGKLVCPQCKRSFEKQRHFNTHKCLASSSYVDITKKEMKIDSGDEDGVGEDMDAEAAAHDDEDEDFTASNAVTEEKEERDDESEMAKDEDEGNRKRRRGKKRKRSSYQFEVDVHLENEGAKQMKMAAESMDNLPIFKNDEEKNEFETCIDVDLSQVDHMFRIHIIEQELNELSGMVYNTPTMSSLSVYSCNVCEKVFKSLSHIRLHCITHTDIKPFKCTKCSYATNSKGNLYTHMRKHTGQFYRCDKCDFKTVNKSHLVEHQMIHTNRRAQCLLCQKDYSTLKSLINHVRKYHTDKKGKEYLQTFLQGRGAKGTTVIHQCHICNRKFKKRIDRDRHLFIHDIKDLPHVQQCELCDYWASRRVYLDKHYLKHRVIYCCSLCDKKFLSTSRLTQHLTSEHSSQGGPEALLTDCINKSLYLPEPLAMSQEGSKYVNLPLELRETPVATSSAQPDATNTPTPALQATAVAGNKSVSDSNSSSQQQPSNFDSTSIVAGQSLPMSMSTQVEGDKNPVGVEKNEQNEQVVPTLTSENATAEEQHQAASLSEEMDGAGSDLSASLKLGLEGMGDASQETASDLGLGENGKGKEGLMMMLQNPGSDSDEEGDVGSAVKEAGKETAGEVEGATRLSPLSRQDEMGNEEGAASSEETSDQTGAVVTAEDSKEKKIQALIQRLGYRKMSTEIFRKMRETFGSEECEYCGRLFYSKADYEPHLRTHTGDKPYACTNCSFRGNTKEQLRKHCEREHEKVAFQCKECDFLAPTRTRLWNHQLKHLGINGLSCPECPSKFDGMKQLRAHILNFHKDMDKDVLEKLTGYRHKALGKMGQRSFKCPHCPRVFIRANSELQKHIWIHEGIKPYTCPICPYACRSKNNLQAHMLRHSAEKPFSCTECGKEYKSKTALRWHVRSHKTGKMFKCDKCPYEATQASHLKRHMETHEVLKRFICKHCDYSANTVGYMKIHYAKHHKGQAFSHEELVEPEAAISDKRVYKCLSCGYLFGNLSDLKRHLKIRHHVLMQDITDAVQLQVSEVEVMPFEEPSSVVASTTDIVTSGPPQPQAQLPAPQNTGGEIQFQMQAGEGTQALSAVSLIQHIMGLSQQGDSQVQVVSEDGQPLEISPDTIVVRQDGQLLIPGGDGGSILPGNQYIIQYYNPQEVTETTASSDNPGTVVQTITVPDQSQQQQQQQQQQQYQQHQQQHQGIHLQQQQEQIVIAPHSQGGKPAPQYIMNRADGSMAKMTIQAEVNAPMQVVTVDNKTILVPGSGGNAAPQFVTPVETDGVVDGGEAFSDQVIVAGESSLVIADGTDVAQGAQIQGVVVSGQAAG